MLLVSEKCYAEKEREDVMGRDGKGAAALIGDKGRTVCGRDI